MAAPQKTIIVGAGPVGSLAAIYAARRGDQDMTKVQQDLRSQASTSPNPAKSINLALSERGINSIRQSCNDPLLDHVLQDAIPMYGRMIHLKNAKGEAVEQAQSYDAHGRFIRAIDRSGLNRLLLDELESLPNVSLFFQHKLTGANFDKRLAWFEQLDSSDNLKNDRHREIEVSFDLMIGADGAHSATRFHLMKYVRMNYQQEYIDTLWCEFNIPPKSGVDGGFRISKNHLHIWPAGDSMFIAIPNPQGDFTCTLFMPASKYTAIESENSEAALLSFFDRHFPGVVPDLITPSALFAQFTKNSHLPLISIKCAPHVYSSSCVILGDAAHAMVPFYGQGMNAGLEDVRVLYDILDRHLPPFKKTSGGEANGTAASDIAASRARALAEYSTYRTADAHSINDLASQNYVEMRSSVRSPVYLARKWVEEMVSIYLPALGWRTQYARVSFENQRYSAVVRDVRRQGRILGGLMGVVGLATAAGLAYGVVRFKRAREAGLVVKWLGHLGR